MFRRSRKTLERQPAQRSSTGRSIHRDFTHQRSLDSAVIAGPEYLQKWALALLSKVEKPAFLLCSKFLLTVVHNIVQHPEKQLYRRMQTSSTTVKRALETEAAQRLLDFIGLQRQGDAYILDGDLSHDDQQRLEWLEEALISTRKKLFVLEAWELFVQDIQLDHRIGAGSFGDVYIGTHKGQQVAIKTLKANVRPDLRETFFQEADIMKTFKHPNVLGLIGVVMRKKPNVIVMPLMDTNLQDVLRGEEGSLGESLTKAMEVAAGLEYIHHQNILHCDLAARNILVSKAGQLKIADFGLARAADSPDCDVSDRTFPIPVRWSAPEVWQTRILSKKTDIWSYGVVFFEIMTAGAVPYVRWKNAQVKQEVADGYRLPCPAECPEEFHRIMMKTWSEDPNERPSCTDIVLDLVQLKTKMADKLAEKRRLQTLRRQTSEDRPVLSRQTSGDLAQSRARTPRTATGLGPFTFFMQQIREQNEANADDSTAQDDASAHEGTGGGDEALQAAVWYHGRRSTKIIKEVTEPLLRNEGDFMVHETRIPGEYILSVMWRIPLHVKLTKDRRGVIACGDQEFSSISDLVQHYVRTGEPITYGSKRLILRRAIDHDDQIEGEINDADEEDDTGTRRDHHVFISYQVETEGALARDVYDAMQSTESAGSNLICFLDQYDLSQVPGEDPWLGGIRSAILSAKVFLVLISENALTLTQTDDFDGTLVMQLAAAVDLHKKNQIQLVPVFVGRNIQINHPSKPNKVFTVYDSYDLFDASDFPDDPVAEDWQMTTRQVLDYIFSLRDEGFVLNPEEDDIQSLCNSIVEKCLQRDPQLLEANNTQSVTGGDGDSGSTTPKKAEKKQQQLSVPTSETPESKPQYLSSSHATRMRLSRRRTKWYQEDSSA
ncbi:TK protein kinase [Salpingoeca rosetta]|uniref:TK protein kinase n=1 Tax=Salpingoeca rosetta (strain ATCC 50818 / BSB-021) TaxID=946362 RepID=F2TYJ2_SALR5|nr:TK protein kinase [Salpingoeca rosetta]EGD78666.1 TK protein kinase [Salpingoeca rosetta]|eukprot:XP_004997624.1 TK protein kinase [Salpingoeca rosetta]